MSAAAMTVEALTYSLRERGTSALAELDTKRRLSQCSDEQVIEVGGRLQNLKPHIGRAPEALHWDCSDSRARRRAAAVQIKTDDLPAVVDARCHGAVRT